MAQTCTRYINFSLNGDYYGLVLLLVMLATIPFSPWPILSARYPLNPLCSALCHQSSMCISFQHRLFRFYGWAFPIWCHPTLDRMSISHYQLYTRNYFSIQTNVALTVIILTFICWKVSCNEYTVLMLILVPQLVMFRSLGYLFCEETQYVSCNSSDCRPLCLGFILRPI